MYEAYVRTIPNQHTRHIAVHNTVYIAVHNAEATWKVFGFRFEKCIARGAFQAVLR